MAELTIAPLEVRFLSREHAAAYLGVSPRTFDAEVAKGWWPKPLRRGDKEGSVTWDKHLLARYADIKSGLWVQPTNGDTATPTPQNSIADAEAEVMEAIRNAQSCHRPKHRVRKAA